MPDIIDITTTPEAIPVTSEQLAAAQEEQARAERVLQRRAQLEQEKARYRLELRIIGREEALHLREHNKFNRQITKSHVAKLAQFQLEDTWKFNGMSITLNGADEQGIGEVLDGGNRLESVIKSGIPQLFVVVMGIDPEAIETYDLYNRKRSTSDALFIRGEENPKLLADTLSWLLPRVDPGKAEAKTSPERWIKRNVLHLHRRALLAEHPAIRAFVAKYAAQKGGPHIPKGLLATLEYLMAQKDSEQATLFMSYVVEPKHLDETDAAYVFRQWFESLPQKRRTKKDYTRIADALTVAWNAVRKGETITAIRIPNAPLGFL